MTPFAAYRQYLSVISHFNEWGYDYFKYRGKVKASEEAFNARKDRFYFVKIARKENPLYFLVSNIVDKSKPCWVGDLLDNEADFVFDAWKKRIQSLAYFFEEDLRKLLTSFDNSVRVENNQRPKLLKLYLQKRIMPETLVIIDQLKNIFPYWDIELEYDITWEERSKILKKYSPFLTIDKEKYQKIFDRVFSEE